MKVTLSYVYKKNSPEDWKTRKCFHFNNVEKIEISDYNKFRNQEVVIYSETFPMITYKDGDSFKARYATKEEINDYCQISENKFVFAQVQKDCVKLGTGIWD